MLKNHRRHKRLNNDNNNVSYAIEIEIKSTPLHPSSLINLIFDFLSFFISYVLSRLILIFFSMGGFLNII